MPTYLVEGSYPEGVTPLHGRDASGVRWLGRYLSEDGLHLFLVCEAPHPEAVRVAASRQGLPIDRIVKVRSQEGSS